MRSIIQLVDSSHIGGIETHIYHLADALIRKGYRCEVVFMADHGPHPLKDQLDAARIPWSTLPRGLLAPARYLQQNAALVNTHGYKAGTLGRLICRLAGIPVVSTWHAGEAVAGKLRFYQWLDQSTARLAPALVVSKAIASQLPTSSTLIRNFIACPDSPAKPGKAIGFVGRLSYEKGPDLFCQIANCLRTATPAMIFGDGPMRPMLEQRYAEEIHFQGAVPAMDDHWQQLSLLCISSRAEGLPLAALEAMARGIPVAAFAVGALPDLIRHGENGFLIEPGDLQSMRTALNDWLLLPDAKRLRISRAARNTITEHYSAKAVLPQIEAIYQQQASGLQAVQP